ncbi:MAG: molybdopterin molybdotransferase [Chloroflexota bacterium]|jgi:molybdenum cofactor synthesis domain-containing protein|nr:molybdopterin molybdotransferase [Chloroflexota bacterium]
MLSVDEARDRLLAMIPRLAPRPVPLDAALGLVLAADVVAGRDLPGFDNSAMDGFAVRAADTIGATPASPARLRLLGEVAAGGVASVAVEPGAAVRIMTGAPLPAGADAVVMVEATSMDGQTVLAGIEVETGRSLRRAGEDVRRGDPAMAAGTVLGPAQLALLAALGVVEPTCVPRPRVAVIPTGDELVDPAVEPGPGQVADVVGSGMPAAVREAGGDPIRVRRAADTEADVRRAFAEAAGADLVISVGGVSMGDYDFVRRFIENDGELDFWKVAMRPGRPLAVGRVGGALVVGLPGNPVSALVGFEVFVLPALVAMAGRPGWHRTRQACALAGPLQSPPGLRMFARASVARDAAGTLVGMPVMGQGSHQLRSLAAANALLDIPAGAGDLKAGDVVEAIMLDHLPGPS